MFRTIILAAVLCTSAAAAFADSPPATPTVGSQSLPFHDWSGFYAGALLGYGQGVYGGGVSASPFPLDQEAGWDGGLYGLALGYNVQNGNIVFGGEFTYSGTAISGSETCVNPTFQCMGEIEAIATLRGRVGYAVGPATLIYGTLGYALADITFTGDNGTGFVGDTRSLPGYVVGLGVEQALTDQLSLRAAILHYGFQDAYFDVGNATVVPDIGGDVTEIELGLMYRF